MSKPSVKIVFPQQVKESELLELNMRREGQNNRIFDVNEILGWFENLEVKSIELWIEASVKTGDIIKLFVSAEGKGGVKVTLVPRKSNSGSP